MRVCHCTGYMNNPGGRCCRDLVSVTPTYVTNTTGFTRRIRKVEYHQDGTVKSVEYFD